MDPTSNPNPTQASDLGTDSNSATTLTHAVTLAPETSSAVASPVSDGGVSGPSPIAASAPVDSTASAASTAPTATAPVTPVAPATAPVAPATAPVSPMAVSASSNPAPVSAVPHGMTTPGTAPVNPIIQPTGVTIQPPVNPIVKPSGLGVTDPIMMPEQPAAPDPIEEELKAPMKAAAPVPGSIGSAVSGPLDPSATPIDANNNPFSNKAISSTPSVSFNDPATQPDGTLSSPKSKTNKKTLIALIVVASLIVVALAAVLIMQSMNISLF